MLNTSYQRKNTNNAVVGLNVDQQFEIPYNYSFSNYTKVGLAVVGTIGMITLVKNTGFPSSFGWNSDDVISDNNIVDKSLSLINPKETRTFAANSFSNFPKHSKRSGFLWEFQVNTYTLLDQSYPSIAVLSTGDFVVVWESGCYSPCFGQDGDSYGIYGQRYSSLGVAQGSEFQINTYTIDSQRYPSVAALNSGDFVVMWQSRWQDGSGDGIYGQRFSSSGVPQGSEFQVNTYTTSQQRNPSVTGLTSGDFVVVWSSNGQDGDAYGVYGQRYSSTGVPQGGEFQINTYTIGSQGSDSLDTLGPIVATLSTGDFVVVWGSDGQDGDDWGIYGQRYSSAGVPQGGEFQINTYTTNHQLAPSIAGLSTGDFVVAWQSNGQDGELDPFFGLNTGIYGQRFSSAGIPKGSEFQVHTYTVGNQDSPSVVGLTSGDFVVVWTSSHVYGQRFSSIGAPQGSEFQINADTNNYQYRPSIATLTTDETIVIWASDGQDGDGDGIYGHIYFKNAMPPALLNNALLINKGIAIILDNINLSASDPDNIASELMFIVSSAQYGQFEYASNMGAAITNFTQQEIIDSAIQFVHDARTGFPEYNIAVSDGIVTSASETATIIYIAQHQLAIKPGEALLLGTTQLDIQTQLAPTDVEIQVSNALFGRFEKDDGSWQITNLFDLSELNAQKIRFVHDGTENTPQYILHFRDLSTNYTFPQQLTGNTILNHPPQLINPIGVISKTINEAFSYTLPNNVFIDPDAQMLQVIVAPLNGTAFPAWISFDNQTTTLSGTPVVAGSYPFVAIATDPYDATAEDRFYIDVQSTASGTPTLITNVLTIMEDQTVVLTPSDLSADDPDGDNNSLVFTVSNVQNGQFEKVSNPGVSITTFTQLEIINGDIQFVHDGNEVTPYYEVRVSDGTTASTDEAATITFNNVNDMPMLNNYNILIISPGQSITIDGTYLSATDVDSDDNTLTFTISNPQNCRFELTTSPGNAINSFTQQQIQNGNIKFVHTQVANLPTFQVSVSDGSLSTTPTDAMTFQLLSNQLVVAPGQAVQLTVDNINVLGEQLATDTLIIVDNISNGYFMQTTNPGQSINSFSLQQIKDGEIAFVKDNRDNAPSYDIKLSYTNANQITPAATPDITLNHPPILATEIQDQQASKQVAFDFTLSENTFYDPDGDSLTVSTEMQDGSTKPTWLQFEPNYRNNRHRFFGTPATPGGVPIRVVASDPYNASVNADFLLQVMGNITNIVNEGTNLLPLAFAIAGGTALLGGCVAAGIVYNNKAQDRKTRQQHEFARKIRHHLCLQKIDNFKSQKGQQFIQAVQSLSDLLQAEQGINIENMDENRLDALASSIAISAKNKITPDTSGLWKKSKISITDFADNIENIARDNRLDDISFAEGSDDVSIPMQSI